MREMSRLILACGPVFTLLLAQGGEFAFVLMASAEELNFLPTSITNYVVLVVGISMALTGPLVIGFERLIHIFFVDHNSNQLSICKKP